MSTPEAPQAVEKTVVGVVQGIMEKPNGWADVHILFVGRQNATKLGISPDEAHLVAEVKAVGQNASTFTFRERPGNINPRSGQPYMDRYLASVTAGAQEAPQTQPDALGGAAPSPAGGSSYEPVPRYTEEEVARFEDKERRDYKSRSWAHTMSAFSHTIRTDEEPQAVYDRLKPFQRKIYEDICGMFAYPAVDDDIPF